MLELGLYGALLSWLVASAGDRLVNGLRASPAQAALRGVVEEAVVAAVDEVLGVRDNDKAEHLRESLLVRTPTESDRHARVTNEAELRDALRRWITTLDTPVFGGPGYLGGIGVDPGQLADALASQIFDGIQRNGRGGGALSPLAEWMWRDRVTVDLDETKRMVAELADASTGSRRSADAVPHQLPAVPADFTGRQRELAELVAGCTSSAEAASPLVVSGLAGVGKSSLVLRLAHEVANQYPDGQLYATMREADGRPVTSEATLARFLRALGTAASDVPAEPAEQAAQYRSLLAGRRVLVVLDDVTAEQQVRALLPGDPSCLVLVTSRNPLPALPSALSYPLRLLDPAESLDLLSHIAGADRVAADPEAATRIVELCGRLPLALRIAAARLGSRPDWTPRHLVTRLSDIRHRLRELRVGDLDVRASFELSYRDLPIGAARLFRRLAIAPGTTFSSGLAATLSGDAQPDTDDSLDQLVLAQMLEPTGDPDRFGMHPLMRVLAHELFGQDDKAEHNSSLMAMFQWHAERLIAFAKAATMRTQAPDEARAWLDAEEPNLIPLLVGSEQLRFDEYTASMAIPVAGVAQSRALWADWKHAIDLGLAAAERLGERDQQVLLLFEKAEYEFRWQHDADAAVASLTEALALVDTNEGPAMAARLHYRLAQLHQKSSRQAEAEQELAAAEAAAALTNDPTAGRLAAGFQAEVLVDKERFEEAIALLEPLSGSWARAGITVEIENRMLLAKAYLGKAHVGGPASMIVPRTVTDVHRLNAARHELETCRQLCRDYGVRAHAPQIHLWAGIIYRALGSHRRARQAWQEGLALFDRAGYPYRPSDAGRFAYELADLHSRADEHTLADEKFGRAAQDFAAANEFINRTGALHRQALEKLAMGDSDGAAASWKAALIGLDQAEDQDAAAKCRQMLQTRLRHLADRSASG